MVTRPLLSTRLHTPGVPPENCVMTIILTQDAKMLRNPLTTEQKENRFFLLEFNDTGEGMNLNFKFSLKAMSYLENLKDCTRQVLKVFF